MKKEETPYIVPKYPHFLAAWTKFETFYFQILCSKKRKSAVNFHLFLREIYMVHLKTFKSRILGSVWIALFKQFLNLVSKVLRQIMQQQKLKIQIYWPSCLIHYCKTTRCTQKKPNFSAKEVCLSRTINVPLPPIFWQAERFLTCLINKNSHFIFEFFWGVNLDL